MTTDQNNESIALKSLTPTNEAENAEIYCRALKEAIEHNNHYNIALTGGYGSGKSSIVETFLKHNQSFKVLRVSLATFNLDDRRDTKSKKSSIVFGVNKNDENEQIQLEISLLQQILYQSEKSDVKFSKLNGRGRIQWWKMGLHLFTILFIPIFAQLLWNPIVFIKWFTLQFVQSLSESLLWNWLIFAFLLLSIGWLLYHLIEFLIKLKVSKIDVKPVSMEIRYEDEVSTLNAYLDEILTVFCMNKFNLVILEDIDRLDSYNLFQKLREINNILRYNPDTKGNKIKFLYSLKESVFKNERDKNKFFDIIIPVVPYINNQNSKDKLRSHISEIESNLTDNLEEIIAIASWCIDDMRTINNIYNEYLIYKKVTTSNTLDSDKLLALIIYKNLFPADFEKIHSGESAIQKVFSTRNELVVSRKTDFESQLLQIEKQITDIIKEVETVIELKEQYVVALFKELKGAAPHVNNLIRSFSELLEDDVFNEMVTLGVSKSPTDPVEIHFADLEKKISDKRDYATRLDLINSKRESSISVLRAKRDEISARIRKIEELPFAQLNPVIESKDFGLSPEVNVSDQFRSDFLVTMLNQGYITEDYKLWISLFHEGALSENDREFLFSVTKNQPLRFDFALNSPKHVYKEMFSRYWHSTATFNIDLFNFLIKDSKTIAKFDVLVDTMRMNEDISINFIEVFFDKCDDKEKLLNSILMRWNTFLLTLLQKDLSLDKYTRTLFINCDPELISQQNQGGVITEHFNDKINFLILFENIKMSNDEQVNLQKVLGKLGIKFSALEVYEDKKILEAIYTCHAYRMTPLLIRSISYEIENFELTELSYSVIQNSQMEHLKSYVNSEINEFLRDCMLPYFESGQEWNEEADYFLELVNNNNISPDLRKELIGRIKVNQIDFTNVKETSLWAELIKKNLVKSSWANILGYFEKNEFIDENLNQLLHNKDWILGLKEADSENADEFERVKKFLSAVLCVSIDSKALEVLMSRYQYYIHESRITESINHNNLLWLIKNGYLEFKIEMFELIKSLDEGQLLHIDYILKYQDEILNSEDDSYMIFSMEELRRVLNESRFQREFIHSALISNSTLDYKSFNSEDGVLFKNGIEKSGYYHSWDLLFAVMRSLTLNQQISFFNSILSSEVEMSVDYVLDLIKLFKETHSKIAKVMTRTSLPDTTVNRAFASHLKRFGLIGRIKEGRNKNTISINRNYTV